MSKNLFLFCQNRGKTDGLYGFTLMELIIAVAIMAVLMAIAAPAYRGWMHTSEYKSAAVNIASAFRAAESRSIAQNLEYEVAFNLVDNSYTIRKGNQPYSTRDFSDFPGDWTVINTKNFSSSIDLRGFSSCSEDSNEDFELNFNPNGTGSNSYVCLMDSSGNRLFKIGVSSPTTGRVKISKWNDSESDWDDI